MNEPFTSHGKLLFSFCKGTADIAARQANMQHATKYATNISRRQRGFIPMDARLHRLLPLLLHQLPRSTLP